MMGRCAVENKYGCVYLTPAVNEMDDPLVREIHYLHVVRNTN